jgi:ligand-binding sensor domain-containing protein
MVFPRLDPIGRVFTSFHCPRDAPQRYEREAVQALAFDADHRLWIGNRDGLEWLDPTTGKRERVGAESASEAIGAVTALQLASNGTLWIAATAKACRVLPATQPGWKRLRATWCRMFVAWLKPAIIRSMSADSLGLHRVDPNAGTVEWLWRNPGKLPVTAISEDHAGRMWLAIRGEGLVAFDPRSKQDKWLRASEEMPEDLPQREINTLFVDRSGLLWVGGDSLGLARVDPDGATFRFILDSEASREHPVDQQYPRLA